MMTKIPEMTEILQQVPENDRDSRNKQSTEKNSKCMK